MSSLSLRFVWALIDLYFVVVFRQLRDDIGKMISYIKRRMSDDMFETRAISAYFALFISYSFLHNEYHGGSQNIKIPDNFCTNKFVAVTSFTC